MIAKIGDFINRVITSVREGSVTPDSQVVVRVGDFGQEMQIEHIKLRNSLAGPIIVIQTRAR